MNDIQKKRWAEQWLITTGLLILLLGLTFWTFHEREVKLTNEKLPHDLSAAETAVVSDLNGTVDFFFVLGNGVANGRIDANGFEENANEYLKSNRGLTHISWLNRNLHYQWLTISHRLSVLVESPIENADAMTAATRARDNGHPTFSKVFKSPNGETGFGIFVPIFIGNRFIGEIYGFVSLDRLLNDVIPPWIKDSYRVGILSKGEIVLLEQTNSQLTDASLIVRSQNDLTGEGIFLVLEHYRVQWDWQKLALIALGVIAVGGVSLTVRNLSQTARRERDAVKQMVDAKALAESANQSKSRFIANVSHEIRTPIGAIIGYTDLLLRNDLDSKTIKKDLLAVRRNGETLLGYVNDLLDLSKVEAGLLEIDKQIVKLDEFLGDIFLVTTPLAKTKGVQITFRSEGLVPESLQTDPMRLKQILLNLLSNAVKFTTVGSIDVKVRYLKNTEFGPALIISVEDFGIGMNSEQKERLFKPFSQGDKTITQRFGGTGLGLALSRHLARLLKGDLVLDWSELGKGSRFSLYLPIGDISPKMVDTINPNIKTIDDVASLPQKQNLRLKGLRILVVDDGVDNQIIVKEYLESEGAKVDCLSDGNEAIAFIEKRSKEIDFIIMDAQMPTMDGYESTRKLRSLGFNHPIVFLTANALRGERERCIDAGGDDYLTKPIHFEGLIECILTNLPKSFSRNMPVSEESPLPSTLAHDPVVMRVIDGFIANLDSRITNFRDAGQKERWDEVARLAHSLKGTAGNYGFPDIVAIAREIEDQICETKDFNLLENSIGKLGSLAHRARIWRESVKA